MPKTTSWKPEKGQHYAQKLRGTIGSPGTGREVVRAIIGALGLWLIAPLRRNESDAGMTTAEYAVGTVAACAFAAVLYQVVTGSSVVSALGSLISSALSAIS